MSKQLQLLTPTECTFGRHISNVLKEAKRKNPTLSWDEIAHIVEAERMVWFPDRTVARTKRDELFVAIIAACGMNANELTKDAARLAATSLAQIKQVTPAVTPDELQRRAGAYKRKYQNAALTPRALQLHWSEFPAPRKDANGSALEKLYVEPTEWRVAAERLYPEADPPWSERKWFDLGVHLRAEILRAV